MAFFGQGITKNKQDTQPKQVETNINEADEDDYNSEVSSKGYGSLTESS